MTAKEWLERPLALNKLIDAKCEELYRLRTLCENVTTTISDMPKGGGNSTIESAYIRLAELREEINADIDRLTEVRAEVERAIDEVEDKTLRDILTYRYIGGRAWGEVAELVGRPEPMTRIKLHALALEQIKTQYIA